MFFDHSHIFCSCVVPWQIPSDVPTLGFGVVVVFDPSQAVANSLQAEVGVDEYVAQSLAKVDSGDMNTFTPSLKLFMTH